MKIMLRHATLALVPVVCGLAAGWGFAWSLESCGRLVGPLFASKCHGRQLQYQIQFQTWGTVFGALLAATIGTRLELRRARAVRQATSTGDPS
ncbi:MAG TPA: hypothetical protein VI160_05100 [Gemmatimonadales bacterium]